MGVLLHLVDQLQVEVVDRLRGEHQGEEGVLPLAAQGERLLVDLEAHHQEGDRAYLVVQGVHPREVHRQRHQDLDHLLAHPQEYLLVEDPEDPQEDRSEHLVEERHREVHLEGLHVAQLLDQYLLGVARQVLRHHHLVPHLHHKVHLCRQSLLLEHLHLQNSVVCLSSVCVVWNLRLVKVCLARQILTRD